MSDLVTHAFEWVKLLKTVFMPEGGGGLVPIIKENR